MLFDPSSEGEATTITTPTRSRTWSRVQVYTLAGIVLSPEFIFESRPGVALPDNRTYGIFWMPYAEVASAFDLDGAFNYLALGLEPGASASS